MHGLPRRTFLSHTGLGVGATALHTLLSGATGAGAPGLARAKRVIFLCMAGGPSHLETFDYKEKLAAMDGQPMPESFTRGQPIAQLQGKQLKCLGPQVAFQPRGESGLMVSDYLPWTARLADEISVIKSMHTTQINHDPAHTVMNTGTAISGRPSMGSWINYGLGSEASDLPGFVVLTSAKGRNPQPIASRQWHSGFLPSRHQGVEFYSQGDPVHYVRNPAGIDTARQRDVVDTVNALNRIRNRVAPDPEIDTRIAQYEMAFRMQASVPGLMDISDEPQDVLDMYGTPGADGSFAANCLLARRLAERGVRFIHLYHRGWDHHGDLDRYMKVCCEATDRATWALVTDLRQRGLLDDTLVVWGGEFRRTPMFQGKGKGAGRDHHIKGFSMWMAGAGIPGGRSYGETDELGYHAQQNPVSVHDLHATMLHLLGLDPFGFSFKFQGLDMRLTGVDPCRVVREVIG